MPKIPQMAMLVNPDTIETFTLADKMFSVAFKDGSLMKWKARQTALVVDGTVELGVDVLPGRLLIGGGEDPATGGKLTRCIGCGNRVQEDGTDTIEGRCFDCFANLEPCEDWCGGVASLGGSKLKARSFLVEYMRDNRPATFEQWNGQEYQEALINAYFKSRKLSATVKSGEYRNMGLEKPEE